ncbi:MAG: type IV toxin-antitoxin system AbiEi family antitoxin domain-containing protein [Solirubrobacterales bacterium]
MGTKRVRSAVDHQGGGKVQNERELGAIERRIAALASRQHGVVARRQLLRLGISARAIERRIAAGSLIPVHRGVYLVGHRAVPPLAIEMAAVLAYRGRGVVSHLSAGAMYRLTQCPKQAVHLTLTHDARSRKGVRVHVSRLEPVDVWHRDGIPLTSPGRTLLDLGACLDADDYERAVAEAWARGLVRRSELEAHVDRNLRRPGTPALRSLLELDRDPARTRSKAERLLLRLIRTAGLPEPETNGRVGGFEVDCVWREQKLVVEFDSWAFHSSRRAFERDRRKDAELLALGYRVLRLTWRRLTRAPDEVITALSRALDQPTH